VAIPCWKRRSVASFALALALLSVAAGSAAVLRPRKGVAEIQLSRPGSETRVLTIDCTTSDRARSRCRQIRRITRRAPNERCLQIWGGASRAVVKLNARGTVITRSNLCESARSVTVEAALR
jgi:hypothetical protein